MPYVTTTAHRNLRPNQREPGADGSGATEQLRQQPDLAAQEALLRPDGPGPEGAEGDQERGPKGLQSAIGKRPGGSLVTPQGKSPTKGEGEQEAGQGSATSVALVDMAIAPTLEGAPGDEDKDQGAEGEKDGPDKKKNVPDGIKALAGKKVEAQALIAPQANAKGGLKGGPVGKAEEGSDEAAEGEDKAVEGKQVPEGEGVGPAPEAKEGEGEAPKEEAEEEGKGDEVPMATTIPRLALPQAAVDPEQAETYEQAVGVDPQAHHAQVQSGLDQVGAGMQQAQIEVLSRMQEAQTETATVVQAQQASLGETVTQVQSGLTQTLDQAILQTDETKDNALLRIDEAYKKASGAIAGQAQQLYGGIGGGLSSGRNQLNAVKSAGRTSVGAVVETLAKQLETDGNKAAADAAAKTGEARSTYKGGFGVTGLRNSHGAAATEKVGPPAEKSLKAATTKAAASIRAQKAPAQKNVDTMIAQSIKGLEAAAKGANGSVSSAKANALKGLDQTMGKAKKALEEVCERQKETLGKQTADSQLAVGQTGEQVNKQLAATGDTLVRSVGVAGAHMSNAFVGEAQGIAESLSAAPVGSPQGLMALSKRMDGATTQVEAAKSTSQANLGQLAASGRGDIEQMAQVQSLRMNEVLTTQQVQVEQSAGQASQEIDKTVTDFEKTFEDMATGFVQSSNGILTGFQQNVAKTVAGAKANVSKIEKSVGDALKPKVKDIVAKLQAVPGKIPGGIKKAMSAPFNAALGKVKGKINAARGAMAGAGTNESALMGALSGMNGAELGAFKELYPGVYSDLYGDLEGTELNEALAHLSGNKVKAALAALDNATGVFNDDEAKIEATLRSLSPAELKQLKDLAAQDSPEGRKAKAILDKTRDALDDCMGKADVDVFDALMKGDKVGADAIRLYEAMDGCGTDEATVYAKLEAAKTPEQRKALKEKFDAYAKKDDPEQHNEMKKKGGGSALKGMIEDDFGKATSSPDDKNADADLALALMDGDKLGASAARLEMGTDWGTDEKAIFKELKDPDLNPPGLKSKDPKVRAAAEKKQKAAQAKRTKLDAAYKEKYGRSIGDMIKDEMGDASDKTNYEAQVAMDYLKTGDVDGALAVKYSVDGIGTNDEFLKDTLKGKSKAELAKMRKDYKAKYGTDMDADVSDDSSGYEGHEYEISLMGKPETPEDMMAIAKKRRDFQMDSWSTQNVMGVFSEAESLENNYAKLEAAYRDVDWKNPTQEQRDKLDKYAFFVESDAATYEALRSSASDIAAGTITAIGAVVTTVLTAGGAAPVWVAVAAAGVTGAAGMGAKYAIKGNSYGWEEAGLDAALTLADMATAGLGGHLDEAGKLSAFAENLVKNIDNPVIRTALAKGIEGAVKGAIGGALKGGFDDKAWDEDGVGGVLKSIGEGALKGAGSGALSGALTGGINEKYGELKPGDPLAEQIKRRMAEDIISEMAGTAVDPATYKTNVEDALVKFGKSGLKGAATGLGKGVGVGLGGTPQKWTKPPEDDPAAAKKGDDEDDALPVLDDEELAGGAGKKTPADDDGVVVNKIVPVGDDDVVSVGKDGVKTSKKGGGKSPEDDDAVGVNKTLDVDKDSGHSVKKPGGGPVDEEGIVGGKVTLEDYAAAAGVTVDDVAAAAASVKATNKKSLAEVAAELGSPNAVARTQQEMLAAIASEELPRYVARVHKKEQFEKGSFGNEHANQIFATEPADLAGLTPAQALVKVGWTKKWLQDMVGQDIAIAVVDTDAMAPGKAKSMEVDHVTWDSLAQVAMDPSANAYFHSKLGKRSVNGVTIGAGDLPELFDLASKTPVGGSPPTDDPVMQTKYEIFRQEMESGLSANELFSGVGATISEDGTPGAREVMIKNNGTGFKLEPGKNAEIVPIGVLTQEDLDALNLE